MIIGRLYIQFKSDNINFQIKRSSILVSLVNKKFDDISCDCNTIWQEFSIKTANS